jgi:hypothetical protein
MEKMEDDRIPKHVLMYTTKWRQDVGRPKKW